eukprot:3089066-Karenia_brevis.AAC.1
MHRTWLERFSLPDVLLPDKQTGGCSTHVVGLRQCAMRAWQLSQDCWRTMHEACAHAWSRITDAFYGVALAELAQRAKAAEAELLDEPRHRKSW